MQPVHTAEDWQAILAAVPNTHLLQSWPWGDLKARYGWQAARYAWRDAHNQPIAAAQVLRRPLARLTHMLYIPKGPAFDWADADLRQRVLDDLQRHARQTGALFLKLDPDVPIATGMPGATDNAPHPIGTTWQAELGQRGWHYSADQVQFRNTIIVALTGSEDDLLARFHQKTRYNIRLAEKKGVTVRLGGPDDYATLTEMYATTAARNGFIIRPAQYYHDVWRLFSAADQCDLLLAEVAGEVVAGLVLLYHQQTAVYMYGMSTEQHRNLMPTYALQWAAMQRARQRGCTHYDLWGAPEVFDESDRLWGVWRFKAGFNGELLRTLGAWDYPANPLGYTLYTVARPRLLALLRRRHTGQTAAE